jgi:hypothetical protein
MKVYVYEHICEFLDNHMNAYSDIFIYIHIQIDLLQVGLFSLIMPYWVVCIIHVENTFCNTFRCNLFKYTS